MATVIWGQGSGVARDAIEYDDTENEFVFTGDGDTLLELREGVVRAPDGLTLRFDTNNAGSQNFRVKGRNASIRLILDDSGNLEIDGDLDVKGGDIHNSAGDTITVSENLTVGSGGDLTVTSGDLTVTSGSLTVGGDLDVKGGDIQNSIGTLELNGTGVSLKVGGTAKLTVVAAASCFLNPLWATNGLAIENSEYKPSSPQPGQFFFSTDTPERLFVYDGSYWWYVNLTKE